MVKAQKRRINQKALVMSEFQSGFEGIELKESAKNVVKGQTKKKSKLGGKLKREDWMKKKAARKAMVNSKVGKK